MVMSAADARIRLIRPTVQLHAAFLDCAFEFGTGHRDGFATDSITDDDLRDPETFAAWVTTRLSYADPATPLPPDRVPDTLSWIVDEDDPTRILGSISVRHELNDFLREVGGHIGYGVRPSARRRGVATAALRAAMEQAKALGLQRVLVTCADDNVGSARTIERCGGVLQDRNDTTDHGMIRRYWIDLAPRATGQCLCGAIRFSIFGELRNVYNCHCHRCRRFTGHHMAATATHTSDLVIDDGEGNLRWFRPAPDAGYAFCRKCGSSLFWQSEDTQRISICAGTLDPPTKLPTERAWWVSEASDYHTRPPLPEYETE